jgi:hypothetical protein
VRTVAFAALLAASCYGPKYKDCAISCESSQLCPSGYHCSIDGYCTTHDPSNACALDDAASSDTPSTDAPLPTGPWGSPMLVAQDSTAGVINDDPSLTSDGLELYFNRADQNIFVLTRTTTASAWSAPTLVASGVVSTTHEDGPFVSADGMHLYFDSTRTGGTGRDLWMASRTVRGGPWTMPVALTELDTGNDEGAPWVSADELTMIFESDRPPSSAGTFEFWIATRATKSDPWSAPQQLNGPPASATHMYASAHLSSDGLVLYVGDTNTSASTLRLAQSIRASSSDPFPAPQPLTELFGNGADQDPWVSLDGHAIYFASNRPSGVWGIYAATR